MNFFSTRDRNITTTPSNAIVEGISPDGGLYLPEEFPAFPMESLRDMSGYEISAKVLSLLLSDFSYDELFSYVEKAYESFDNGVIAPLQKLGDDHIMELWHGPTCAFKDVALSLLPYLLTASAQKCGIRDEIVILTATSGDTGSAALSGFSGVAGTSITVFYPEGGVSPMQKRQMVTNPGKNTAVCAIRGNFDDAQSAVKRIFTEVKLPKGKRFSSANSINIGRLAPQIAYYFTAYRDLLLSGEIKYGECVNFIVPTGNFGDILAGYFAKKMGLFVGKLVSASNENRVLADFFETGVYDRRREFHLTSSPSMDILISSNLERLIAMTVGCEKNKAYMQDLKEKGIYSLAPDELMKLRLDFDGAWVSEEETAKTIKRVFDTYGYLIDPHTAVAYAAKDKVALSGKCVILSTASAYKFTKGVLSALGEVPLSDEFEYLSLLETLTNTEIPKPLASLKTAMLHHKDVVDIEDMADYVLEKLEEVE